MGSARIRMYRQGLGDCFLLTFPGGGRDVRVLVDCGVLTGTPDGEELIRQAATDIAAETGGELDALVVTHEHWDHVSGFIQARDLLEPLRVREVWMAWTEKPGDPLAEQLAGRRARALRGLVGASSAQGQVQGPAARAAARRADGLLGFFGGAAAAAKRAPSEAMRWAKERPGATLRYLRPDDAPFDLPGAEGVRVYVLGPPHDPKLIRKSDPSKRSNEVYPLSASAGEDLGFLAAVGALESGHPAEQPFEEWFRTTEKEARERAFFQQHYGFDEAHWQQIEEDWLSSAGPLALRLDADTNNTSLVLAFELLPSGRVLLFPGDAQVGNWLSWEGVSWKMEGAAGGTRTVTAYDLLARTVLYKVAHHGSHNATLREKGLELMTSDEFAAMLPLERRTARRLGWKMPFPSLLKRLEERTRGRILDRDGGVRRPMAAGLSDAAWAAFEACTEVQEGWMEYRVDS